ncbi:RHS repeat-associated core domain protein containing protein [Herbaspirillum sp. CF444]|uniref:RHS repeat-associated core domain-containing protein n=1 Tax=Herbaspirillum sp. CF444 TaxID=1144319 RepID=UPI0002726E6B|nr:RHS repeat-associated core domain-containing protein [Herbaspirillum sp. CF444]EJL88517.1 RHS repeat-associated core domain protein containing protein [Herbaspirillum sp. CF444]
MEMRDVLLGYNGQRRDPVSGTYHLGNGYRAYNPVLMRFNCPDSLSPFGAGGINPYAYCAGDPINQADPSGHMSTGQWIGLGLGLVAGIALSIVTDGAAMPAVLSLAAMVTGDAAIGAVAEGVAEAVDGQRVDWASVGGGAGVGVIGSLIGWGGARGIRAIARLGRGAARAGQSAGSPVVHEIEMQVIKPKLTTLFSGRYYPVEKRILDFLDTESIHNLRQASEETFGEAASSAMVRRGRLEETGVPPAEIKYEDFVRRWSRLSANELESKLAHVRDRERLIVNPAFRSWMEKNFLGLGRSRPDRSTCWPNMLEVHFCEYEITGFDLPSEAIYGPYRQQFLGFLRGYREDFWQALRRWDRSDSGFWVGF